MSRRIESYDNRERSQAVTDQSRIVGIPKEAKEQVIKAMFALFGEYIYVNVVLHGEEYPAGGQAILDAIDSIEMGDSRKRILDLLAQVESEELLTTYAEVVSLLSDDQMDSPAKSAKNMTSMLAQVTIISESVKFSEYAENRIYEITSYWDLQYFVQCNSDTRFGDEDERYDLAEYCRSQMQMQLQCIRGISDVQMSERKTPLISDGELHESGLLKKRDRKQEDQT